VNDVTCYHQEHTENDNCHQVDRRLGHEKNQELYRQKCPLPSIRPVGADKNWSTPKVSIYIPAYNAAKYIRDAVSSVLEQSCADLEIVICDDGSTDNTLQVLEHSFSNTRKVRWFSQSHCGIGTASNRAVRQCRGMYIGQLDSDDLLEPTAVEQVVDILDNEHAGAVYSDHLLINRHGTAMKTIHSMEFTREWLLVRMICTAFRMFRKRDWLRTEGFDETLTNAVDYDMMLKLSEVCDIIYLPEITYRYRFHGQNTSLVRQEQQEHNHVQAVNKALVRMNLDDQWQVVPGPISDPRRIRFIRHDPPLPSGKSA
jgi:chondroitin synthase